MNNEIRIIEVREEPIELCQLLKFATLTQTGGEAKQVIAEGLVKVNNVTETRKRKKLVAGDVVTFDGQRIRVAVEKK